jgi:hypothetical protein
MQFVCNIWLQQKPVLNLSSIGRICTPTRMMIAEYPDTNHENHAICAISFEVRIAYNSLMRTR